jgi:hypothetical protein
MCAQRWAKQSQDLHAEYVNFMEQTKLYFKILSCSSMYDGKPLFVRACQMERDVSEQSVRAMQDICFHWNSNISTYWTALLSAGNQTVR